MKTTFLDFEQPIAELEGKIEELSNVQEDSALDLSQEVARLQKKSLSLTKDIYGKLGAWQISQVARHPQRPYTLDYLQSIFTDFEELHGDRAYADDPAIVGGLARFDGQSVMVIGHQKGRDTKEKIRRNFGMPRPEGYRKALRLMRMAEKFGIPVMTFIDTPGAYPGIGAEERGQSEAIARNLYVMSELRTPIICTIIGEGGSGGALAIGVGDVTLMLQYSSYCRHFARRLRLDPVEERGQGAARRGNAGHHGQPSQGAGTDRQDRQRTDRRRPSRPRHDDADAQKSASGKHEPDSGKSIAGRTAENALRAADELWQVQRKSCLTQPLTSHNS